MGSIIEYVKTEMRTFTEKPFSAVDSLVLSQIAYFKLSGLVPGLYDDEPSVPLRDLYRAECFDLLFGKTFVPDNNLNFLTVLAASPRFRNMRLNYYVSEIDIDIQMQFSAVTFFPDDGSVYIAYRGTDGTLVGWKEDCNMAFTFPLPAQEAGLLYMNSVSGFISSDIVVRTGGHSKGGNIAMYAAMKCNPSLRNRITDIYNHDGPGFISEVLLTDEYASISDRVRKTLPHSSFFGMLLHQGENYTVVESSGISGFLQHIPFNWVVENGDFRYIDKVKNSSFQTQIAINEWLRSHTPEEQKHLIDTIFGLLETTKVENFNDMNEDWLKTSLKILSAAKDMDPETKKFVQSTISSFVKISLKALSPIHGKQQAPALPPESTHTSSI